MNNDLSDNHSHIILHPIESMVAAAKKKNVNHYSITEHISQFREPRSKIVFGSTHVHGRMFENFKEYKDEFKKIERSDSFELRSGLEVDFIPRYAKTISELVGEEHWDILLCSVHELSDGLELEAKRPPMGRDDSTHRWKEYIQVQKSALESDFIPFNTLTHPVRLSVGTPDYPENIEDLLFELARTARKAGKALELNGADIQRSPTLVEKLAVACGRAGCMVSLGSDAHSPESVFKNIPRARQFAEKYELTIRS